MNIILIEQLIRDIIINIDKGNQLVSVEILQASRVLNVLGFLKKMILM
ncbi:MAG: hypothetical protein PQ964_06385 [Methanobacteriaceae archaeon]|jgi:uncharacterized protein YuzE